MAAITLTVAQVKFATGIGTLSDTDATRLGSMAAALVEKYAEDAPDGVKLEAAMRLRGLVDAKRRLSSQLSVLG